tara:strand:+ start:621 stop:1238 length:618 start_codon:yes stop_codon:yes gene_type:complete
MATFEAQILDIIGGTLGSNHLSNIDDAALNDYLISSARTVIDLLDDTLLNKHTDTTATTSSEYAVDNKRVVSVTLGGYGCREIPFGLSGQAADENSIHFATAKSPIYFIDKLNKVSVLPTGTEADVNYIAYPTIDADVDTAIANFPDSAEYAVVLGAAIKVLQNVLSNYIHVDEDSELAGTMQVEINGLQAMYQHEMMKFQGAKS